MTEPQPVRRIEIRFTSKDSADLRKRLRAVNDYTDNILRTAEEIVIEEVPTVESSELNDAGNAAAEQALADNESEWEATQAKFEDLAKRETEGRKARYRRKERAEIVIWSGVKGMAVYVVDGITKYFFGSS